MMSKKSTASTLLRMAERARPDDASVLRIAAHQLIMAEYSTERAAQLAQYAQQQSYIAAPNDPGAQTLTHTTYGGGSGAGTGLLGSALGSVFGKLTP